MPFELICNASSYGIGAVLFQQGRPLACYSRKMSAAERNYVVMTEQELLVTVEAMHVFCCYLLSGQQLTPVTEPSLTRFCKPNPTYVAAKLGDRNG